MITDYELKLRPTAIDDLDKLFEFQFDREANQLAAFTSKDPTDREAFFAKHKRLLNDDTVNFQTILVDGQIAGSIAKFIMQGEAEVTYWIDKAYWGKGVATLALKQFLTVEQTRPLYGRVAFDNIGSQRVLERCGFLKIGSDRGFATARGEEIEEFIYQLDAT